MSVMWSPLESKDGPGRHSGKDGDDNRSTSTDTSLPRMCINDETTTDGKQNGDILQMQSVSPVQKSGIHISYYGIMCFAVYALMFSSSAHGGAGDGIGLRFSGIGRELHNAERVKSTSPLQKNSYENTTENGYENNMKFNTSNEDNIHDTNYINKNNVTNTDTRKLHL